MIRKLKKYKPTKFMAKTSRYDKESADHAVNFIQCLTHTKGIWAGKPFELIDWQEQIIRDLFGILKPNGYRQFNTAYIEVPKKTENPNWLQRLPCFCAVRTERNAPKFMDAPETVNRRRLFLTLPPT